jgi:hypothetical protein
MIEVDPLLLAPVGGPAAVAHAAGPAVLFVEIAGGKLRYDLAAL